MKKTIKPIVEIVAQGKPVEGVVRIIYASRHPHIEGGGALNSKMYEVSDTNLDEELAVVKAKYIKMVSRRYDKMGV